MPKEQTWFDLVELRKSWNVSRAWLQRQIRAGNLLSVKTVNGQLVHKSEVRKFVRDFGHLLRCGQVEKEVEDIAASQLHFEFSNTIHELEGR